MGLALRERGERLQRTYALDSAGEEAALIVSPLAVAVAIALASPRAALVVAAVDCWPGRSPPAAAGSPRTSPAAGGRPAARPGFPSRCG